jgi:hypothetical protein
MKAERSHCVRPAAKGVLEFFNRLLETNLNENHSGELQFQSAEAKAERIIAEELRRLGWTQSDLAPGD